MEVGKIITREMNIDAYDHSPEQNVSVDMDYNGIWLRMVQSSSGRALLTSEQAIELGQLLLKAAEIQPEYTEAVTKLDDERKLLDARYKDLISGLGLAVDMDVIDERGTFKVIESS